MVDLTSKEEDRKLFITKLELNDDKKSFKIVYADGHEEVKKFDTVHNFNVYLHRMREQFYKYEDEFKDDMLDWIKDSVFGGLVDLVISLETIILTSRLMDPGILKTVIIVLTILLGLSYMVHKVRDISVAGNALSYLDTVDRFIHIQERLKVPVYDPRTGRKDEWYLANLSNIGLFSNISVYETLAYSLEQDEELKEEAGASLTRDLKGE